MTVNLVLILVYLNINLNSLKSIITKNLIEILEEVFAIKVQEILDKKKKKKKKEKKKSEKKKRIWIAYLGVFVICFVCSRYVLGRPLGEVGTRPCVLGTCDVVRHRLCDPLGGEEREERREEREERRERGEETGVWEVGREKGKKGRGECKKEEGEMMEAESVGSRRRREEKKEGERKRRRDEEMKRRREEEKKKGRKCRKEEEKRGREECRK